MAEVIVFPDVTEVFCDYLRVELNARGYAGIHVATSIPATRPARFVRVLRTGGGRRNLVVDDNLLTIECWAALEEDAHDIAKLARGLVAATRGAVLDGTVIYQVGDVTGPGALPSGLIAVPDPLSGQARFSFSMLVSVRGTAIA